MTYRYRELITMHENCSYETHKSISQIDNCAQVHLCVYYPIIHKHF